MQTGYASAGPCQQKMTGFKLGEFWWSTATLKTNYRIIANDRERRTRVPPKKLTKFDDLELLCRIVTVQYCIRKWIIFIWSFLICVVRNDRKESSQSVMIGLGWSWNIVAVPHDWWNNNARPQPLIASWFAGNENELLTNTVLVYVWNDIKLFLK